MIVKNLLTLNQIIKAANTSDIVALKCGVRHWDQIALMTTKEFETLPLGYGYGEYCPCCLRWGDGDGGCTKVCPLKVRGKGCANGIRDAWDEARIVENTQEFRKQAKRMVEFLKFQLQGMIYIKHIMKNME